MCENAEQGYEWDASTDGLLEAVISKKTCEVCFIEKNLIDFHLDPKTKDGYRNECKVCRNQHNREKYKQRKAKIFKRVDFDHEKLTKWKQFLIDYCQKMSSAKSLDKITELQDIFNATINEYKLHFPKQRS